MKANLTLLNFTISRWRISTKTTTLEWDILVKAKADKPVSKKCMLFLTQKNHIIFFKGNLLNSKNDLITKCRHEKKFYLVNYKDNAT